MRSTLDHRTRRRRSRRGLRLAYLVLPAAVFFVSTGCTEFSHFGAVHDREAAHIINGVIIEQQRPGGGWTRIGETDGKGAWNIFKYKITGGLPIRLRKPGYQTVVMNENEFLQQSQILMTPSAEERPGGGYTDPF